MKKKVCFKCGNVQWIDSVHEKRWKALRKDIRESREDTLFFREDILRIMTRITREIK